MAGLRERAPRAGRGRRAGGALTYDAHPRHDYGTLLTLRCSRPAPRGVASTNRRDRRSTPRLRVRSTVSAMGHRALGPRPHEDPWRTAYRRGRSRRAIPPDDRRAADLALTAGYLLVLLDRRRTRAPGRPRCSGPGAGVVPVPHPRPRARRGGGHRADARCGGRARRASHGPGGRRGRGPVRRPHRGGRGLVRRKGPRPHRRYPRQGRRASLGAGPARRPRPVHRRTGARRRLHPVHQSAHRDRTARACRCSGAASRLRGRQPRGLPGRRPCGTPRSC